MSSTYNDFLEPGNLVVGRYSPMGDMQEKPLIVGSSDELKNLQKKLSDNMKSSGAVSLESVITVNKKVKKGTLGEKVKISKTKLPQVNIHKTIDPEFNNYHATEEGLKELDKALKSTALTTFNNCNEEIEVRATQKRITFQNNFGKIRLEVEDVIRQNNFGIMLVFTNDNKLTFIPKTGETLEFSDDGNNFDKVFYPGSLFDFHGKIIMILFNKPDVESMEESLDATDDGERDMI